MTQLRQTDVSVAPPTQTRLKPEPAHTGVEKEFVNLLVPGDSPPRANVGQHPGQQSAPRTAAGTPDSGLRSAPGTAAGSWGLLPARGPGPKSRLWFQHPSLRAISPPRVGGQAEIGVLRSPQILMAGCGARAAPASLDLVASTTGVAWTRPSAGAPWRAAASPKTPAWAARGKSCSPVRPPGAAPSAPPSASVTPVFTPQGSGPEVWGTLHTLRPPTASPRES